MPGGAVIEHHSRSDTGTRTHVNAPENRILVQADRIKAPHGCAFCTEDFGPLEVVYDYEAVGRTLTREAIASRPRTIWRYRELLPALRATYSPAGLPRPGPCT